MNETTRTFEVKPDPSDDSEYAVRIRLDRPGVAAVSYTGDAYDLIKQIADAAGLEVAVRPEGATAD